jgi:hypothetical protein
LSLRKTHLGAACSWGLIVVGGDPSDLLSAAVGQEVHGLLGEIEAIRRGVDGGHENGGALEFDTVALSAVGAVPAGDADGTADSWVPGDVLCGLVALGHKAVCAVRAGCGQEVEGWVVVCEVVGDGSGSSSGLGEDSQRKGEEREN